MITLTLQIEPHHVLVSKSNKCKQGCAVVTLYGEALIIFLIIRNINVMGGYKSLQQFKCHIFTIIINQTDLN